MTVVINYFSFFSIIFLLLPLPQWCEESQECDLYKPSSPGIQCLRNYEVEKAVTKSEWAWMLELYSSWCGHCQQFAPRFKELAKELEAWSPIVRVGVFECTESNMNQKICSKFGVQAYPTIRFFQPMDSDPLSYNKKIVGGKGVEQLRHLLVDHILSIEPHPSHWPNFNYVKDDSMLRQGDETKWTPTVFVFEGNKSYVGAELILDFVKIASLRILRVPSTNAVMVRHYSILEFPSIVIELRRSHYHLISGHSAKDPRSEFKEKIVDYVRGASHAAAPATAVLHGSVLEVNEQRARNARPHPQAHHYNKLQPHHFNRVELVDLLGAISYSLRSEVIIHSIVSGPTFISLFNYVTLLEQAFSYVKPVAIGVSLKAVRLRLEGRRSSKFIVRRDLQRILDTKLDETVFPKHPKWKACNGSLPHLRGYPCALWMLMHTLTVLTLPIEGHTPSSQTITSYHALTILIRFIRNFFSCEVCREHFIRMANNHTPSSMSASGDAVLWLWQTHNLVNARLERAGGGDPSYPKDLFPSYTKCPYCYLKESGDLESLSSHFAADVHPDFNNTDLRYRVESTEYSRHHHGIDQDVEDQLNVRMGRGLKAADAKYTFVWNHTAVLLYLWNFYHLDYQLGSHSGVDSHSHHVHHHTLHTYILFAAWPEKFGQRETWDYTVENYLQHRPDPAGNGCLLYMVTIIVFLALTAYWLYRRKRCRRLLHSRIKTYKFLEAHAKV